MPWYRDWLFYSLLIVVFILDRVSKEIIRSSVAVGTSWPDAGLFRIVHGLNTGSAFGLFIGFTNFLIVASVLGIALVLYLFHRQNNSVIWLRLSLGMIVGGAVGNLFDRLKDGAVIDFISVGWWPAFNLADSAISVGMALLVTTLLFGERLGWIKPDSTNEEKPD